MPAVETTHNCGWGRVIIVGDRPLLEPGVLMGPRLVDHGQVKHLGVAGLLPGAVMPCRLPLCQRIASSPRWRRTSNSPPYSEALRMARCSSSHFLWAWMRLCAL